MAHRAAMALLCLALLPGCFLTRNQAASAEYARQVMVASTRVAVLEEQLAEAGARVESLEEAMRAQGATVVTRLENMEQVNAEVGRLRGELEVMRFELDGLKQAIEGGAVDGERRMLHTESRLAQLEDFLGVEPPPPPTMDTVEVSPPEETDATESPEAGVDTVDVSEGEETPEDAAGKLTLAVSHMQDGRHGVARVLLEKALMEHPDDPLLPELRYRLAETWFNQGSWDRALTSFQTVVDSFGDSDWAARAMLRQGECFARKDQQDNAELFYEEVIRLYPRSEAAEEARAYLEG